MALASVKIRLEAGIGGSVEVNGQDISSYVKRVVVEAGIDPSNRIPTVYLELHGGSVDIEGEGVVSTQAPGIDTDEAIQAFVASLEPETLEALALGRLDGLSGETTTGEAFVAVLKELASGDDDRT